jgi:DNA repair exonuclease SbcCD ATPase subunit
MTLGVEGAGGGNGYKGSSGGERRRIDVALLLALADVAAGASSENPGTLFLDEVLDAIDEEGVGLLASALQEVATRRPIILITHSETLAHAVGQFASDHLNLRATNERI